MERRNYIKTAHERFVNEIKDNPKVGNARCMGVILAIDLNIEMERYGNLRDKLYQFFMENGVILRPLGNTVYVLPPYVITNKQLTKVYHAIKSALKVF